MYHANSLQCAHCFHVQDGGRFCVDCGHDNLMPLDGPSFEITDDGPDWAEYESWYDELAADYANDWEGQ